MLMATVEAASGPRYAPDDPTLPKPWKGLIDGSTGVAYYWNPQTNITQYERPGTGPPPSPAGHPPAVAVSQSDSAPAAQPIQPNAVLTQHGQHIQDGSQQRNQYMNQASQPHEASQAALVEQPAHEQVSQTGPSGHQGSRLGQSFQPPYPQYGQTMQYSGHQFGAPAQQGQVTHRQSLSQVGQQSFHPPGQLVGQHVFMQISPQLGQQAHAYQGAPVHQPMQHHFPQQQQQRYMQYPQPLLGPGHQSGHYQAQFMQQGPSFSCQPEDRAGYPQKEDNLQAGFPRGNQVGFSPSQAEQPGDLVPQSLPGLNTMNTLQAGCFSNQFSSFSGKPMQQPNSTDQLLKTSSEAQLWHGKECQIQMVSPVMHSQQHGPPPVVSNTSDGENQQGSAQHQYLYNEQKGVPTRAPRQTRFSTLPMSGQQQEMMLPPHLDAPPSREDSLNAGAGHGFSNMYSHGNGDLPISNNAMIGETSALMSADAYCIQHEVTATGENIPAPFMAFEVTGFPPEILREVRYLLQMGSICRTLHC